ncbi:uncharacterized protein LY89DRAFT_672860 [Mollisia scopiformis]|uniref:Uncharacterized protein n=1 Tax=Mollisia scopiformis TaxID=149040 RepID=A0A194WYF8_MOLSC|nr:uncharacterized protein LY89DRAFT_672860 [Mollisia scopiformis]KUJ12719.1 hypothetical protein LY89DRAFT_672860 [Mollisia scopiformis]
MENEELTQNTATPIRGTRIQLPLPSECSPEDLDPYHSLSRPKKRRQNATSKFIIYEDATATEANIIGKEDELYEREMEKICVWTNRSYKEKALKAAIAAVEWAIPVAALLDKIRGAEAGNKSLNRQFERFKEAICRVSTVGSNGTANAVGFKLLDTRTLARLMARLLATAKKLKGIPEVKNIKTGKMAVGTFYFVAGYCVGGGCGLESPDVLKSSTTGLNSTPAADQETGPVYYQHLCESWALIFRIHAGRDLWKEGYKFSTTISDDPPLPPPWAATMIRIYYTRANNNEHVLDSVRAIYRKWRTTMPWFEPRPFGTDVTDQRDGAEAFQDFYEGEENDIGRIRWRVLGLQNAGGNETKLFDRGPNRRKS